MQAATKMSRNASPCAWQASKPHHRIGRAICRSSRVVHRDRLRVSRPVKSGRTNAAMETLEVLQEPQQPCISTGAPSSPESRDTESDQLVSELLASGPSEFSSQPTPYDAAQDWESRYGHYGSKFKGTVALHTTWTPRQNLAGSMGQDEPAQQWHGLRAAKASAQHTVSRRDKHKGLDAEEGDAMHYVNLYDRQLPGDNRNKLDSGLWQSTWVYTKQSTVCQEGFLHPYVETEGPLRARTIGTTAADLATCRFSLPYAHLMPQDGNSAGSMWNCEMSMLDVDGRGWMLGPMYDMHTGQLLALFHAREYQVGEVEVDDPRDLQASPPLQPPRHRLAGPPQTWLTGEWEGAATSLTFHPDGSIMREPVGGCQWKPPNNSVTDNFLYALYTMPDCCYVFCPIVLPVNPAITPMRGMSIEAGCLTGPGRFHRTIMEYSQDGSLRKMTHEEYKRRTPDVM